MECKKQIQDSDLWLSVLGQEGMGWMLMGLDSSLGWQLSENGIVVMAVQHGKHDQFHQW